MIFARLIFIFGLILLFPNVTNVFGAEFELSMNDIEWCEEVRPLYDKLGLNWFLENNHHSIEARVCASLYGDSIWNYEGDDRTAKLLERSLFYIELELQEGEEDAKKGEVHTSPVKIPPWIKTTTGYWVDGLTSDVDLVNGFQWLIQNDVIHVPYAESSEDESTITIPSWIKTIAGFWVNGEISDDQFLLGIEWLINNGIIRV